MTEQKDKCPECKGTGMGQFDHNKNARCDACNGTRKITKKVKWDREKVAELLFCQVYGGKPPTTGWPIWGEQGKDKFREQADQLYKELTKE